ncbi:hypothetical protein [Flavobacterium sp. GP15]|uniref:hypothetical protein n=1 Tax=Flavobacterium sp. GP15 TaxID=2758567 RepID=UPI00165DF782|nr:hypothetical protein [Flavobacterium sp. GP15]
MGTFLAISVVQNSKNNTEKKLIEFSENIQGDLKSLSIDEQNILYSKVKKIDENLTSILYPEFNTDFYNCAQFISKNLNTLVFTFYIYDNDFWYFLLYRNGKEISRFTTNSNETEENPDSWICNYVGLAEIYKIDVTIIKEYLEKISSKNEFNDCLNEISYLLNLLNFPTNEIFSLKNYKSILSKKTIESIQKPFISLFDLRKTKKYTKELIQLKENEVKELFEEDIDFIKTKCKNATNIKYSLNIECLTLEVFGKNINEIEPKNIINLGFTHKMEQIQDFLNK